MPRKLKLSSDLSYDYTLFGISCHLKDYRFAFFMNDKLGFRFKRTNDLVLAGEEGTKGYSFFRYLHPEERRNYYLVANYHEAGRLIPSEKGADYFLIADGMISAAQKKTLAGKIQSIPQVLAAYEIPKGKAKNLEVIFTEIELHFLEN